MPIRHFAGVAIALLVGCAGLSVVAAVPGELTRPAYLAQPDHAVRVDPPKPALPPMLVGVLDRVNAERASRGLGPMTWDDRLGLAATLHSSDQAARGQMTHIGSDGSTVAPRVGRVGYPWASVAENVASGYPDAASVMAAWMASDSHRSSILSANTHIGVGLAYGADGQAYWTVVFASLV